MSFSTAGVSAAIPFEKPALFNALRDAGDALKIRPSVIAVLEILIRYIPTDAPAPISPLEIQTLADQRGLTTRAVRNSLNIAIRLGIVSNQTFGNGWRRVCRNINGEIEKIFGIDFSPLLRNADEFRQKREKQEEERIALRCACKSASGARRRLHEKYNQAEKLIPAPLAAEIRAVPTRFAGLKRPEVMVIFQKIRELSACLAEAINKASSQPADGSDDTKTSGMPEVSGTALYYTKNPKKVSYPQRQDNPTPQPPRPEHPENQKQRNLRRARQAQRQIEIITRTGLHKITLGDAFHAAPPLWNEMIKTKDWYHLVNFAADEMKVTGLSDERWSTACLMIGREGAAVLAILFANRKRRNNISDQAAINAWFDTLIKRIDSGKASLHSSVRCIIRNKFDYLTKKNYQ